MTVLKIDFAINGVNQLEGIIQPPYLAVPVAEEATVVQDLMFLCGMATAHLVMLPEKNDDLRIRVTAPFDTPDFRAISLCLHKAHIHLLKSFGDHFEIGLNIEEHYFTFKNLPSETSEHVESA